jgi:hypothetical protein
MFDFTLRTHPAPRKTLRALGGSVAITSNSGSTGVVWGLATVLTVAGTETTCGTYKAMLNAYDPNVDLLWSTYNSTSGACSGDCFTIARFPASPTAPNNCGPIAGSFVLPTVVNGNVYIPTFSFTTSGGATQSGVLVYCGTGTTPCNGSWQN